MDRLKEKEFKSEERKIILLRNSSTISKEIGKYFSNVTNMFTKIQVDEEKLGGMPVIRDTRIPVSLIVACLKDGMSVREICEEYDLAETDIEEAMEYVIEILDGPY